MRKEQTLSVILLTMCRIYSVFQIFTLVFKCHCCPCQWRFWDIVYRGAGSTHKRRSCETKKTWQKNISASRSPPCDRHKNDRSSLLCV